MAPDTGGRHRGDSIDRSWRFPLLLGLAALLLVISSGEAAAAAGSSAATGASGQRRAAGTEGSPAGSLLERPAERLRVEVLDTLPHDRQAFTQGLVWYDGGVLESTGLYGESTLRRVAVDSGTVLERRELDAGLFGEGLARVDDRLIQLTWREGRALVWTLDGLTRIGEYTYDGEGWGLCHDGATLFMSDGSPRLTLRDPVTFARRGQLDVSFEGRPVGGLNELECAEGWIYANVYGTRQIVRIDPSSGRVTAVIDATGLPQEPGPEIDVLNGIAYRPDRGTFLLTGKKWPTLFEVAFVPATRP